MKRNKIFKTLIRISIFSVILLVNLPINLSAIEDLTGPEIFNFTFSPSTIDISASSQTITSTMRITDDISGVNWGQVHFRSPSLGQSAVGNFALISGAGDELDGMYEASVTIPLFSEAGIWNVWLLIAGDNIGNNTSFNQSELIALGFPTELEVVSSSEDLTGPEIFNFTFSPSTIDISASSQTITSTMRITDDISGVNWGQVHFRSPSLGQSAVGNFALISGAGDELDGMYEASVTIPLFSEAGIWNVWLLIAGDNIGNNTSFNQSELIALGFPTELEVVSSSEDLTGPEIFNFTFSPSTIDISASSQTITSTMRITDDISGVNWGQVHFRSPSLGQSAVGNFALISGAGDELDGMYEASVTIPLFSEAGIWNVWLLIAGDNIGNNTSFNQSELIALGFPTELEVVSIIDNDGDGIPDDQDACPFSDLSDTVVIDGWNSGVDNVLLDDGCTISDLISQCAEYADNHGEFVSAVSHTTNALKKEGIISGKEKGMIQKGAARAAIP